MITLTYTMTEIELCVIIMLEAEEKHPHQENCGTHWDFPDQKETIQHHLLLLGINKSCFNFLLTYFFKDFCLKRHQQPHLTLHCLLCNQGVNS